VYVSKRDEQKAFPRTDLVLILFPLDPILLLLLLPLLLSCATLLILGWLARDCAEALCNDAGHDNAYLSTVTGIPDLA
jgi:hypothetical protein